MNGSWNIFIQGDHKVSGFDSLFEQSRNNWWFEDGHHRIHSECGPRYTERSSRTQFAVSINVWRLAGDTLNFIFKFLYCNRQVQGDFLITLYFIYLYENHTLRRLLHSLFDLTCFLSQMGEQIRGEQIIQQLRILVFHYETRTFERRRWRDDTYNSIKGAIVKNNTQKRELRVILRNLDRGNENHTSL